LARVEARALMSRKDYAGPSAVYAQSEFYGGVLLWYGKQTAYCV